MRAGDLRHRVTIERLPALALRSRSASGQVLDTWSEVATVWAAKLPPTQVAQFGNEFPAEGGRFAEMTDIWVIRGGITVTNTDRLKWASGDVIRYYDILGVADVKGVDIWLHLLCKEGNTAGT